MTPNPFASAITRRVLIVLLGAFAVLSSPLFPVVVVAEIPAATEVLPSWNDGPAKQAIVDFVKATTDPSSPNFVPPEARIATFDQDGTLWVEHPIYSQVVYCLDRVPALVKAKPELANVEPFKTVLSGDREATYGSIDLEYLEPKCCCARSNVARREPEADRPNRCAD